MDNQDGTCTVSYLPVLPGDYSILVKYNDKHIPGSPFAAKITGNSRGPSQYHQYHQYDQYHQCDQPGSVSGDDSMRMSQLKVGSTADIPLDIGELDLTQLTASLTPPSGREEPCLLKMLRNGHVGRRRSQPRPPGGRGALTPPSFSLRHLLRPEGDRRALGEHQEERPPHRQQPHLRHDPRVGDRRRQPRSCERTRPERGQDLRAGRVHHRYS